MRRMYRGFDSQLPATADEIRQGRRQYMPNVWRCGQCGAQPMVPPCDACEGVGYVGVDMAGDQFAPEDVKGMLWV